MRYFVLAAAFGTAAIATAIPANGYAQAVTDEQVAEQKYISLRFDVWSQDYRIVARDGYGMRLTVALSTALFRYRTLDDLFARDIEHMNAVGVRPRMELEYPTSIANISFVPEFELALNHSPDTSNKLLSATAEAALLYRHDGDDKDLKVKIGTKYGTRSERDSLNIDDYLELNLRLDLRQMRGLKVGQRRVAITPFGQINRYAGDLTFLTERGALFEIDRQYELGVEFETVPKKKIWGISLPILKISYVYGDDFKGVKIRF